MKTKGKIRPLERQDFRTLAEYLEEKTRGLRTSQFWMDRFHYWWEYNPAMEESVPMGWILMDDEGAVGGFLGNIPVFYQVDDKVVRVCSGTSWFVDETLRHRSLEFLARFNNQKNPLLNTTPIDRAFEIFKRLGFDVLEQPWLVKEAFYPVNTPEFVEFFLNKSIRNKKVLLAARLAKLPAALVLKALLAALRLVSNIPAAKYNFREIRKFDQSHDDFFTRFAKKYRVTAKRDSRTLNWFFFGTRDIQSSRRVLEFSNRNGKVAGYVAVKLVNNELNNKNYYSLEVVDLALTEENKNLFLSLLKGLAWLARSDDRKIAFVKMNIMHGELEHYLKWFGFFQRAGHTSYLYRGLNQVKEYAGPTREIFFATPLDGDRPFF